MKNQVVILAAGKGSRLWPHTAKVPKGMVPVFNRSIVERNMDEWNSVGACNFCIVTGYKAAALESLDTAVVHNDQYDNTNMVWSLACALEYISSLSSEYVYVSYADIVVHRSRLQLLAESDGDFCIGVDLLWRELWAMRMDDYLSDVETFHYSDNRVIALGDKPGKVEDVNGQYMGLLRFKRILLVDLLNEYVHEIEQAETDAEKIEIKNLYMTDFIQRYIDKGNVVTPVFFEGGWFEVDTVEDLSIYIKNRNAEIFNGLLSD